MKKGRNKKKENRTKSTKQECFSTGFDEEKAPRSLTRFCGSVSTFEVIRSPKAEPPPQAFRAAFPQNG